jgi:hypothetical protein
MFLDNLSDNMRFCVFVYVGLIVGVVCEIANFCVKLSKNNCVMRSFLDILIAIFGCFAMIFCINSVANGYFRGFFLLGFVVGIVLERVSLGFLVAKGCLFVYNISIKIKDFLRRDKIDPRKTKKYR